MFYVYFLCTLMLQILWDENLKKWVNLDPDDEVSFPKCLKWIDDHCACYVLQEDSGPAAPPSDAELKGNDSAAASNSNNQPMKINTASVASNTTSNPTTNTTSNNPPADKNIYSRRSKRLSKNID